MLECEIISYVYWLKIQMDYDDYKAWNKSVAVILSTKNYKATAIANSNLLKHIIH